MRLGHRRLGHVMLGLPHRTFKSLKPPPAPFRFGWMYWWPALNWALIETLLPGNKISEALETLWQRRVVKL